ncbi:MAG: trypsin-like peptidase domain-containing protein [Holophagales bacterium]|nr:trypsin-like peptidase domain-containing protein [Holophagales bacterium]
MRRRSCLASDSRFLLPVVFLALGLAWASGLRAETVKRSASPPPVPCKLSIPELYEAVAPSVVSVTAMAVDSRDAYERVNRQAGSGVIVDPVGLVVTNSHVVFGRQAITVTLDDGTVLPARIVGLDPIFDVAVLRIPVPGTGKLPAASFTESGKLHVGDEVFAIGNPLGLEQTLTRGIVSAVNRILPGASWSLREPLIQTDAAINHGNSGGPLVDQCGKVVGINTAMLPDAQGIGFAIPSDLIVTVLPELVAKGRVIRPWLGVQGQVVPPTWKQLVRIPPVDGFLVEVVEPGSPAAKAGLQGGDTDIVIGGVPLLLGGDMIVEMNGRSVGDPVKMAETVAGLKLGETVRLTIVRGDQTLRQEIVLEERPILPQDVPGGRTAAPAAGELAVLRPVRRSL